MSPSGRRRKAEGEDEPEAKADAPVQASTGFEVPPGLTTVEDLEAQAEVAAPTEPAPRGPSFMWSGQPVYQCRLCGDQYERVNNLPAVLEHERSQHPTNARQSHVLGPDGRPLIVVD